MVRTKKANKLFKNLLRTLPAIPILMPKKRSIAPFLLGAIGVALAGGIAAIMLFSPRTRHRAIDMAKGGYGKVRGQLDHGWAARHGLAPRVSQTIAEGRGVPRDDFSERSAAPLYESTGL